jgi:hypothetical protein
MMDEKTVVCVVWGVGAVHVRGVEWPCPYDCISVNLPELPVMCISRISLRYFCASSLL